jgi:hypothetical protein
MIERQALIRPQAARRHRHVDRRRRQSALMPCPSNCVRVGQCRLLLRAHRLRGVAFGRLPAGPVIQLQRLGVPEHRRLHRGSFGLRRDVLGEVPVEIQLGECRVVPRQRGQHLVGIACRRLIGLTDDLSALEDCRTGLAHPHRADVLFGMPRRRPPRRGRLPVAPPDRGRAPFSPQIPRPPAGAW